MFTASAKYYDLIYSFKDYASESKAIAALIAQHHPTAKSVLDVGCGTAEHLRFLPDSCQVEGLDLAPGLLELAQAKFPGKSFHCADMSDFHLGKRFDVVLCLFSSIGYVLTVDKLQSTLACFAQHLNPGGIVVVEPWFSKENWKQGNLSMLTHDGEDLKICRMTQTNLEDGHSILHFQYLIAERGQAMQHLTERHALALFEESEFRAAFQAAGLAVDFDPQGLTGRGLYVGRLG